MREKVANAQHEFFIPCSDGDSSAADVECRRALNPKSIECGVSGRMMWRVLIAVILILFGSLVEVRAARSWTAMSMRSSAVWAVRAWRASIRRSRQRWVGFKAWAQNRWIETRNALSRFLFRHGIGPGHQVVMAGLATSMVSAFPVGRVMLEDRRVTEQEQINELRAAFERREQASERQAQIDTRWKLIGVTLQTVGVLLLLPVWGP